MLGRMACVLGNEETYTMSNSRRSSMSKLGECFGNYSIHWDIYIRHLFPATVAIESLASYSFLSHNSLSPQTICRGYARLIHLTLCS